MTNTKKHISKRVIATLIDYTLIFALTFFYINIFGVTDEEGVQTVSGLPALIPMLFWFLYFVVVEFLYSGTLGHQVVGLKIVSIDNSKLTFGQILKRRLADIVEISWCFGFVAFLIAKGNHNGQRLGDTIAKTIVTGKKELSDIPDFDFNQHT